ncbi:4-hydroxythreonine-4-phosphate dehydrogenase PdxA [Yoonia sediminilitoris]|uniref:4-hydroxythreonine-4-phosphate dehydrogenase n=1 Tax=Yoonia sediminilitoris TaxID=1286148 RepID=A0A2T6KCY1_9RHOB|nr:4-hydroxythreonine-4-phosphate dehydrogenase PdxA [Yoonia sediminilitoris]PUB12754.1 4-hydroxythreonine-4-phosphate dehydrogenase [Yoonia sediminilitoris]RCW94233.1 4-hydroxythreonine-4-phosphate dehydrogenase [Yoonia sediminilitoris]
MKPIAVSCGEPAGIGPEIAVAAWAALGNALPLLWIGDPGHLPAGTDIAITQDPSNWIAGKFNVLARDFGPPAIAGTPNPAHAQGVIDAIATAVSLTSQGTTAALCTAPIHKAALADGAGFAFPGHTEYLAHLAGAEQVVMMLACPALRVVPATIHIPLSAVPQALTPALLRQTVDITHKALIKDFGIVAPRIAVAGLNPHAGEDGKIGTEEQAWINDTIAALRQTGMDINGPMSADTMFHAAARATYDAAICMYHDQALIPIKTIDFAGGVNVTLGLPFIRTSPDHGTAFDIAGQGKADPTSMIAALRMAAEMAQVRHG